MDAELANELLAVTSASRTQLSMYMNNEIEIRDINNGVHKTKGFRNKRLIDEEFIKNEHLTQGVLHKLEHLTMSIVHLFESISKAYCIEFCNGNQTVTFTIKDRIAENDNMKEWKGR